MKEYGLDGVFMQRFFGVTNRIYAIFKVSDTPPNKEKDHFIDNDGMPSDHYLWLTGPGAKMLRKEIPLSFDMHVRNQDSDYNKEGTTP